MNVWGRRGLKAAVGVVLLLLVFFFSLVLLPRSPQFRNWLQAELSARTGSTVRLSNLRFNFPLGVAAENVQIDKPGVFSLQSERLTVIVNPLEIASNTIHRLQLEKSVLRLDLQALMKQSNESAVKTGIRQLNVHNGTVVLEISEENTLELPNINLDAENLNLAQAAGIALKTDVPWLRSEADVVIKGVLPELEIALSLRPKIAQSLLGRRGAAGSAKETLQIQATLHTPEKEQPWMTIAAKSQELAVGAKKLTGRLDARINLDAKRKAVDFSAQAQLAGFPASLIPQTLPLRDGPAEIAATGDYSWASRSLAIKSLNLKSHLGAAEGRGHLTLGDKAIVNDAQTALREVSWEALKTLLPAPLSQWTYRGLAEAELTWHGPLDALDVNGLVRSAALQVSSADFSIGPIAISAPVQSSGASLQLKEFRLQGKTFAWKDARRNVTAEQLLLEGTLDHKNQAPLQFAGRLTLRGNRLKAGDGADSSAEQIAIEIKLDYRASDLLKAEGQIQLAGAKFASPDNSRVAENLAVNGSFNVAAGPAKTPLKLSAKLSAQAGEILWGKFFGDCKAQKPVLEIDGDYWQNDDRLDCRGCDLTVANVGQIKVKGAINSVTQAPDLSIQARSDNFLPGGFFEIFLRETFKRQYPILEKIAMSGQMTFQVQAQGGLNALTAAGEVSLKNGEVRAKSKDWQIGPIAIYLPFQLSFAGANAAAKAAVKNGTLAIQSARFGAQTLAPVSAAVSLFNNTLKFPQPVRLGVFGGAIEINNLLWPNIITSPKELSFSANASRLQLLELTRALGWHPLSGTLTASIPQVRSTENVLRTVGDIRAELFGGSLEVAKLEIEEPFSPLASIKLDTTLRNINLEQASKTFEFGRISGILEGQVDELVITNGQPSQFRADLHSVDRGTEQRISVESLDKITVLSSGQSAGAAYGGLASFFDSFRYSKLGFKATLKNDKLSLRGIESRGGKEFLVVGSILPPTVNIISHTQQISFGELVRRLEQIQKSDKAQTK